MKIAIQNFGPIKEFCYDLEKDLIITYGNNNIGKSYAMQIVYLLLKTFLHGNMGMPFRNGWNIVPFHIEISLKEPENTVQRFIESGKSSENITSLVIRETYQALENVLMPEFMNSCSNTFGNLEKTLENQPVIQVSHDKYTFEIDLQAKKITGNIVMKKVHLKRTESDFHKSRNYKDYLDIYVMSSREQPVQLIEKEIQQHLIECIRSITNLYNDVYFLPASRSGIYSGMNAFGSIVAELSRNRAYFTKRIEFPGISEPISDYFISLSNIKSRVNDSLSDYYTRIENDILKGKVTFDKSKNALIYKPENVDAAFEMTEVSSMVSEISPIVAFLKYILTNQGKRVSRRKSILFIEEPEAHLHPNNQIALIGIFAELIHSDIKLIMSSHSNYIFNKLNNLVLAGKLDYHQYQPIILTEQDSNGSVSKCLAIDELGAEDENFVDVSHMLYAEREEIIQRLNCKE